LLVQTKVRDKNFAKYKILLPKRARIMQIVAK
jgi:hypothetical protein